VCEGWVGGEDRAASATWNVDVEGGPDWLAGRVSRWFDARGCTAGSDLDMLAVQLVDAVQDVGGS
jgi:hypothetical protein